MEMQEQKNTFTLENRYTFNKTETIKFLTEGDHLTCENPHTKIFKGHIYATRTCYNYL